MYNRSEAKRREAREEIKEKDSKEKKILEQRLEYNGTEQSSIQLYYMQ